MSGGIGGPVVTLDGPAGAGKTTTARAVARTLGFRHLDSGALYRGLTHALLSCRIPEDMWPDLTEAELRDIEVSVDATSPDFLVLVGGRPVSAELRTPEVTARVSYLAGLRSARACLLDLQRAAGAAGRLVADGRDMGTVVFPDADVKIYLVAELEARTRRRLLEDGLTDPTSEEVASRSDAIAQRDRLDSERDLSPLRRPEGALEIDTTKLSFDDQVAAIVALVDPLTAP